MKITTHSTEETRRIASDFASQLKGGEIIGLVGDLGSGKTTFVQGIAEHFGIKEIVNSPTFNIMKIYPIKENLNLCHLDVYRLSSFHELEDLGADDFLGKDMCITLIEWVDKFKKDMPKETKYLYFTYLSPDVRLIEGDL